MRILAISFVLAAATLLDTAQAEALDPTLDGREIYSRVLDNRLNSAYLEQRMISTDPGGDVQELRFWSRFRDYRTDGGPNPRGVISKTTVRFTYPQDKRDAAYLFIERHHAENEGFNYSRFRTKVMRVNTRKETIFGTDFTLEDMGLARILDDAEYERHADEEIRGAPVYVVSAVYKPESYPQYKRSLLYVDPETYVPLRVRHWNDADVEIKILRTERGVIEEHEGVWIPMVTTMLDLAEDTNSVLYTDRIEANPELEERFFDPKRLGPKRR